MKIRKWRRNSKEENEKKCFPLCGFVPGVALSPEHQKGEQNSSGENRQSYTRVVKKKKPKTMREEKKEKKEKERKRKKRENTREKREKREKRERTGGRGGRTDGNLGPDC